MGWGSVSFRGHCIISIILRDPAVSSERAATVRRQAGGDGLRTGGCGTLLTQWNKLGRVPSPFGRRRPRRCPDRRASMPLARCTM